jgi:hypothetical protein
MTVPSLLMILSLICFVLAALPVPVKANIQLVPLGLAFWVLSQIIVVT